MTFSIGIDIGGTNTVMGLVDDGGHIVAQSKIKTQEYGVFTDFVEAISTNVKDMVSANCPPGKVRGIGVGAPNGNFYSGCIEYAANLPWKDASVPLASQLQSATGLPVTVTNDANAAAMGEMAYGVARGMKDFIMITLGTGVGSGIVIDGKLVYGHDGFAGELGHVIVDRSENARQCGCGRKGCLETYCSATGMVRTAVRILEKDNRPSMLRNCRQITSLDIFHAAQQGDSIARDIFEYTGRILGQALANFVTFSAPQAIILFGGPTAAGSLLTEPIKRYMEENLPTIWKGKVSLLVSEIPGGDAAVLGASALV